MSKKNIIIFIVMLFIYIFPITAFATDQSVDEVVLSMTENSEVMQNFIISNMMPGDVIYQKFDLEITLDSDVKVKYYFVADEDSSAELLSALQMEVYLPQVDQVLYVGSMEGFDEEQQYIYVEAGDLGISTVNYEVMFSLSTEVGNECMDTQILGEFIWTCEEVDEIPAGEVLNENPVSEKEEETQEEEEPQEEEQPQNEEESQGDVIVIPAPTGDDSNVNLYLVICALSIAVIIGLLYFRNRRKKHE